MSLLLELVVIFASVFNLIELSVSLEHFLLITVTDYLHHSYIEGDLNLIFTLLR